MKKVTSNDIARLAGVSRSTVSRVLNGYSNVPDETRKKVMKIVKEHHYYPQLSGQLLTGMSTRTIGLFWFGNDAIANDSLTSSYFMHIIDAAAKRGYLVLANLLDNLTDKDNINQVRKIFMEGRIDAGIFVGLDNNEPLIDELVEADKIVGLFDYYHENEEKPLKLSSLSIVPPVCPNPRPLIFATVTPNEATIGVSASDVLSPTPPVECLSTLLPSIMPKSSVSPLLVIAIVSASVSFSFIP